MMPAGRTIATRRAKPSHELWQAHQYQRRASDHLCAQAVAALFLDPGLGKTSIVLDAFSRLKAQGVASRMLVVAPLRVCQTVWRQEGQKWTEFRDLRFSLLHGPKKADRLKDDADVWLINPEGIDWLCQQYFGRQLPFDTVTIDELTKFKNPAAKRSKVLRKRIDKVARKWGLTGTPAPNGYMDLFGQFLILDNGAALGPYVTHFRTQYFQVDFNGFDYSLQPGAERRIEERIKPYVLRMAAEDYLELPPIVDDVRELDIEPSARSTYARMKKDMLAELPEGVVTGANAAAVYSKLKQMANGAVYVNDAHDVAAIHNTKLDALDELIEELNGQQLLLAYEFNHDLDRLKRHYGDKLTVLGKGDSSATVEAWNRGEIPLLACHPASAAHGLNLQYSSCAHVAWFSPIWDLELYQQFIRRIRRQGNDAQRIVNHLLVVRDTIDELALAALRDKDTTQARLLHSLNAEISGQPKETETMSTVTKLSRQSDAGGEPRRIVPKGWGAAATAEDTAPAANDAPTQRERIQQQIAPVALQEPEEPEVSRSEQARSAFSQGVQQQRQALEEGKQTDLEDAIADKAALVAQATGIPMPLKAPEDTKPVRSRRAPTNEPTSPRTLYGVSPEIRVEILKIAAGKADSYKDTIALATHMLEFVAGA